MAFYSAMSAAVVAAGCGTGGWLALAAGPMASARTDGFRGTGWSVFLCPSSAPLMGSWDGIGQPSNEYAYISNVELAFVEDEGSRTWKLAADFGTRAGPEHFTFQVGWAAHLDDNDAWGTGPRIGLGIGFFAKHSEIYLLPTAYAWLGADGDDGFDAGAGVDVRLVLGARF